MITSDFGIVWSAYFDTNVVIKNPTDIDLYIKIDGRRHILKAGRSIHLEDN